MIQVDVVATNLLKKLDIIRKEAGTMNPNILVHDN
jgi:hypothetical protein